jgi:hypothetical protein
VSQYILDTDHISLILRNHPQVIANASRHSISVTIITVQEVFSGRNHTRHRGHQDRSLLYKLNLSREAQLFVGWVSALRNPCGRWVSCFNPTYVYLIFNSTHPLITQSREEPFLSFFSFC